MCDDILRVRIVHSGSRAFRAPAPSRACTIDRVKQLIALAFIVLAACGRDSGDIDSYIGAACDRDSQCDERCYTDPGTFPGGFCSIGCNSDRDCPGDTVCTDKEGGVCMFLCSAIDCRDLGPGWRCTDEDNVGGGKDNICRG